MEAIRFKNVVKKFGNFYANKNMDFVVDKGEVHALLGENGAGKSTLMNVLFGIYEMTSGEIYINGELAKIKNPNDAKKYNIGMVHQHFQLVETFTVAENIYLGIEITNNGKLSKEEMNKNVQKVIDKYNFKIKATDIVSELSVGQQQKIEILKMLFLNSEILIFDEPTGALTPQEINELLEIINNLKNEGKTIILITHKLDEIQTIADKCTIIRKGETIKTVKVSEVDNNELAFLMVGRKINFNISKNNSIIGETLLKVENITTKDIKNISFEVKKGEILGIAGIDGNGQNELIDAILGYTKVESGSVYYKGKNITNKKIREINNMNVGYIPQDRQKLGLILDFNIAQNSVLKNYYKLPFVKNGFLQKKEIEKYAFSIIEKYDVRSKDGINSDVRGMSGGNQQKLIIGRELELNPDLLIAMQPTRGVDIGAIENIQKQLLDERAKGKAIILSSLELEEILKLSDRIAVMYDGKIIDIVDAKYAKEESIGLLMAGIKG